MAIRLTARLLILPLLAAPAAALAQDAASPLVPGLERFDLDTRNRPAPIPQPTPAARPTPRATPTARATTAPRPIPVPSARSTPAPRPTTATDPVPAPVDLSPADVPTPVPAPAVTVPPPAPIDLPPELPAPVATATATAVPATGTGPVATGGGIGKWSIAVGTLILAALGLLGYLLWQRRRRRPDQHIEIEMADVADNGPVAPLPVHSPAPPAPADAAPQDALRPGDLPGLPDLPAAAFPPAPPPVPQGDPSPAPFFIREPAPTQGPRARLEFTVRPQRAGTNLTSAAVDYEIDIRNTGDADAIGIRMDLRLLSASADQDAILAALYAAPIDKPVVAPFDITAGDQVSLGGMALMPREALTVMTVQNRAFFVPLLSLNLVYGWGGAARGQVASAHVIGIERPDDAKMAPFRLDTGARMYDRVGERIHTLTVVR